MNMKEMYDSGDWIALSRWHEYSKDKSNTAKFLINRNPNFNDGTGEYKLIHKKHSEILDAYLADNDVYIDFMSADEWTYLRLDFIHGYSETYDYRIAPRQGESYTAKVLSELGEDNFAKYGFEKPSFECELLYNCNHNFIQGYVIARQIKYPRMWNIDGVCFECMSGEFSENYNLTPIKKPWYEDESNFPVLMKDNKEEDIYLTARNKEHYLRLKEDCRLATNEEIDQLKVNS